MNKILFLATLFGRFICFSQVQVFEKNISNDEVFGMSISPDGEEMLFVRAYGGRDSLQIFQSVKEGDDWSDPKKASFSIDGINQIDPSYSPDGRLILINMIKEEENGYDVYVMERTKSGLGDLRDLSASVNTEAHEFYATMSKNGNVYFTRRNNSNDIYMSQWDGTKYLKAIPLSFNTDNSESNPYIHPQEKFVIFTSKTDNTQGVDLFISFKKRNKWSNPINLGKPVNSSLNEFCPSIDLKNKRFLFSRTEVLENRRIENMFFIPLKDLNIKNLRKQASYPD
ncbi:MAG: hypothetical protein ABJG47_06225 [Ekhidna sp.]